MTACSILVEIFSQDEKKEKIKKIAVRCAMVCLIVVAMFLYLMVTKTWNQFINYTFLGLGTFQGNRVTYLQFLLEGNYGIALFSILLICLWIFTFGKTIKLKDKKITLFFIYSLSTLSILYPITDANHILIALLPTFVLGLCLLFPKDTNLNEKMIKQFSVFLTIGIVILSILFIFDCYRVAKYTKYKHYHYIYIAEDLEEDMENVTAFIQKYPNTYILSTNSILYMIPLDRYNGILDLPNVGNLGQEGEQALIDYIEKLGDAYILTLPSKVMGGANQNPKKVAEYIEENYEYVGILENFEVYHKK